MARPEKLELLEKGNIGSHSPHHPNNIKNCVISGEELTPAALVQRLLQQQQQYQQAASPPSSQGSSTDGSAPSTPTKPAVVQQQVSLIEIRPEQQPTIRTLKLEPQSPRQQTAQQVIQASRFIQHGSTRTVNQNHYTSLPSNAMIKGEFITIKNEPDVVVKEEATDTEEEMDVLSQNFSDPTLSDIALHIGSGIWDELSSEGITLDDLPISSSNFNFSFSTNSLTSSPATVQNNVTGVC